MTKALFTEIKEEINLPNGKLVLESHEKYPKNITNVYRVDNQGKIMWFAEIHTEGDYFLGINPPNGKVFTAYESYGYLSTIDLNTGAVLTSILAK